MSVAAAANHSALPVMSILKYVMFEAQGFELWSTNIKSGYCISAWSTGSTPASIEAV
jgi:hypothetical protein